MKRAAIMLIVLLLPAIVMADGMVITTVENVGTNGDVDIGAQRAVLWLQNKDLVLEIEPKFQWDTGGAAWIIPLPAKPEVFQGDPEFLDDLEWLTRPRFVMAKSRSTCGQAFGCIAGANGSAVSEPMDSTDMVTIWESGNLGKLDYVIISGASGQGILGWLNDNGFHVDRRVESGFKNLDLEHTFFFAAKLSKPVEKGKTLGTIGFRFPNYDKPFYPVALTASGLKTGQHLDVLLWVVWPTQWRASPDTSRKYTMIPVIKDYVTAPVLLALEEHPITQKELDDADGSWIKAVAKRYESGIEDFLESDYNINTVLEFSKEIYATSDLTNPILAPGLAEMFWMGPNENDKNTDFRDSWQRRITNPNTLKILGNQTGTYLQRYHMRVNPGATSDPEWVFFVDPYYLNVNGVYVHWETVSADCGCGTGKWPINGGWILLLFGLAVIFSARRSWG